MGMSIFHFKLKKTLFETIKGKRVNKIEDGFANW